MNSRKVQTHFKEAELSQHVHLPDFFQLSDIYLRFFSHSEHTSLPDYKGSGGQRWTDSIFSLHRQWTQKGQFPPLASGEIHFYPLVYTLDQRLDQRVGLVLEVGPLEINVSLLNRPYCLKM